VLLRLLVARGAELAACMYSRGDLRPGSVDVLLLQYGACKWPCMAPDSACRALARSTPRYSQLTGCGGTTAVSVTGSSWKSSAALGGLLYDGRTQAQ
jgi:hypothetical protein